jgi:hypothetical protein
LEVQEAVLGVLEELLFLVPGVETAAQDSICRISSAPHSVRMVFSQAAVVAVATMMGEAVAPVGSVVGVLVATFSAAPSLKTALPTLVVVVVLDITTAMIVMTGG